MNPNNPGLKESDAYPAEPDSEYGWEKLFSERLFFSYYRNYGSLFGLLGIIISLVLKEPGLVEKKKHQQQFVERSLNFRGKVDPSRCGETVYKLVHSCSLMNA
jgi:hypothetical protein